MTPKPKIVKQVCSLCGLDWKEHGKEPTEATCIKLLLDEVRSLNARLAHRPVAPPAPYIPYPVYPWKPHPYWPTWYSTGVQANTTHWQSAINQAGAPQALTITSSGTRSTT